MVASFQWQVVKEQGLGSPSKEQGKKSLPHILGLLPWHQQGQQRHLHRLSTNSRVRLPLRLRGWRRLLLEAGGEVSVSRRMRRSCLSMNCRVPPTGGRNNEDDANSSERKCALFVKCTTRSSNGSYHESRPRPYHDDAPRFSHHDPPPHHHLARTTTRLDTTAHSC